MNRKIILAITGASGSIYAREFLQLVQNAAVEIHAIISDAGRKVMMIESGIKPDQLAGVHAWYDVHDFTAPMASGSSQYDGMLVLPCSMGTLAAIANGLSMNLIHRAADVVLKEKGKLILAVRETPFNRTHIVNMLAAHDAGAVICPAMPSFYHQPADIIDLALAFAGRLCDLLGIEVDGIKRWEWLAQINRNM